MLNKVAAKIENCNNIQLNKTLISTALVKETIN